MSGLIMPGEHIYYVCSSVEIHKCFLGIVFNTICKGSDTLRNDSHIVGIILRIISQNRASSYEFDNISLHICTKATDYAYAYREIEYIIDFQNRSEIIAKYTITEDDYFNISEDKRWKIGYDLFDWIHQRYAEGCSVFCMPDSIEIVKSENDNNYEEKYII